MQSQEASIPKAALWMGGWLAAMVTMAVAGRETVNQLSAFQVMELRALIGLVLLSRESEWAARKLTQLKTRYPRFGKTYDEADRRAMRLWRRLRGNRE